MEDLVLNSLLRPGPLNDSKSGKEAVSYATTTDSLRVLLQPREESDDEGSEMSKEAPLERPESPLSSLGHIGLVRSQRNALSVELRQQQDASAEAKRSVSSLRKLALRLAVRISVKEAKVASHARALARARMNQYLAQRSTQDSPTSNGLHHQNFPLSPPQSPGPNKPLPALPRLANGGRMNSVRFSPQPGEGSIHNVIHNGDDRFTKMDASRASLKEELEVTQRKLARLFESQAMLREQYNVEREKSRNLDAECQQTHAKISSLEQSKQQIEDEARRLHERVDELERANEQLRSDLSVAKIERHGIEEDLGNLQSSKLTLFHQLQAAAGSKDDLETQLKTLHSSSNNVKEELERKLTELENESRESSVAIAALEAQKKDLDEDLRITKFRLAAAVDLEAELRSQLSKLHAREFSLEHDLKISRQAVAQLEEDLHAAYERLAAMDDCVTTLTEKLEGSEKSKLELEEAARLARESKDRIEMQIRKMEKNRAKVDARLRSTRTRLVASENTKTEADSEITRLRHDLTLVQKRNEDLETLVEKAETTLGAVVEKTTASVSHLESIVADSRLFSIKGEAQKDAEKETNGVEQQLLAHQREIDILHKTNVDLMEKLENMTKELNSLKTGGLYADSGETVYSRSVSRLAENSRPGSPPEVAAAEELYELEVKQLRETRATFDKVVRSLQAKNTELEVLESWVHGEKEDDSPTPKNARSPVVSIHEVKEPAHDLQGIGWAANAMQPKVVRGHYAASVSGILDIHTGSPPLRRSASDGTLRSKKNRQSLRHEASTPARPQLHRRATSETLGLAQDDLKRASFLQSLSSFPARTSSPMASKTLKELPLRPMHSTGSLLLRNLVDKELPRIPRRPVGGRHSMEERDTLRPLARRAKTVDDIDVGKHVWSLFPKPSKSMDLERPATASGYTPFNSGPRKWSMEAIQATNGKHQTEEPRLGLDLAETEIEERNEREEEAQVLNAITDSSQRYPRLKKSFSMLTSISKRSGRESPNENSDRRRIRSLFHRPSKLLRNEKQDVRHDTPTSEPNSQIFDISTPNQRYTGILGTEPVGIYDPVTKMWLTPQKSPTRTRFGVYDPDSKQWMAPSPRSDSLRRVAQIDKSISSTTNRDSGATEATEDEQGALSLAEKLEIIRYNPLTRTISTPNTSVMPNRPSTAGTANESMINSHQENGKTKPWKPGQVLGLSGPPEEDLLDPAHMEDDLTIAFPAKFTPRFAEVNRSMESGSGYMSFESDYEAKGRDWKGLFGSVRVGSRSMLRRVSNLRKPDGGA